MKNLKPDENTCSGEGPTTTFTPMIVADSIATENKEKETNKFIDDINKTMRVINPAVNRN